MSAVCRACLSLISVKTVNQMLLNSNASLFTYCTTIEITKNDMFTKAICSSCFDMLNKFSVFKKQCIRSNQMLHCVETNPTLDYIKSEMPPNDVVETKTESDIVFNNSETAEILIEVPLNDNHFMDDSEDEKPVISIPTKRKIASKKTIYKKTKFKRSTRKKILIETENSDTVNLEQVLENPERLKLNKLFNKSDENKIICHLCNKKYKHWDGLHRHCKRAHLSVQLDFECSICGKLYTDIKIFKRHLKTHKEKRKFICHMCGKSFRTSSSLRNHLNTHQENREKSYECKICAKTFTCKNYLRTHMFRHKERRFVCQVCHFPFFAKADLVRHMRTHEGIKPFICKICNKGYSTKSFLMEHGRMHSGERPFSCDHCSMSFICKRRLIDHRRTHTGEKPHKCDKCNQAFIQRGSLSRHLKTHVK